MKPTGRCPYDQWVQSRELTDRDRAALDQSIGELERVQAGRQHRPDLLKKYLATRNLHEIKVRGDKKQLRPMVVVENDSKITIICGFVKKGSIKAPEVRSADALADDYLKGVGHAKRHFED